MTLCASDVIEDLNFKASDLNYILFHYLFSERKEPYPAFQSLVASLTAGPVAFADGIGKTDKDILMRSYCWVFKHLKL